MGGASAPAGVVSMLWQVWKARTAIAHASSCFASFGSRMKASIVCVVVETVVAVAAATAVVVLALVALVLVLVLGLVMATAVGRGGRLAGRVEGLTFIKNPQKLEQDGQARLRRKRMDLTPIQSLEAQEERTPQRSPQLDLPLQLHHAPLPLEKQSPKLGVLLTADLVLALPTRRRLALLLPRLGLLGRVANAVTIVAIKQR